MPHPPWRQKALQELLEHARKLRRDKLLGPVVRRAGPITLNAPADPFHSLTRAIVSQQISVKAAESIYLKLAGLLGGERRLTARNILLTPPERLRTAGLSGQKVAYLTGLAQHAADGRLPLARLHQLPDEKVSALLVAVPGIGQWTADMFLMFFLARPDVWPVGDLGLREALARLHGVPRPSPGQARDYGEKWLGRRSVAAWYLWRSLEGEGGAGGIW